MKREKFKSLAAWALTGLMLAGSALAEPQAWAKLVKHKDGSQTESKVDPLTNSLEQTTKSGGGVIQAQRVFGMDSKGRIRNGLIFDGKKRLLARIEYGFDEYDRINEERIFHGKGPLIRRALFKYDPTGRRLPSQVYLYDPSNIHAKPTLSTKDVKPIMPITPSDTDAPGLGIPSFRGMEEPAAKPPPAATPPTAKKQGFFQKLLNKK